MTTPRSRRPRPASAAVTSKVSENMIQAAHGHLVDSRESQEGGGQVTRLVDLMDSFPLVPLPVISQLGIGDLEKVESGLNELLRSLMPHESDQQLGRYATRQLALVQRQLTQQRAQERVFQMLRGDLSVDLAPIRTNTLRKSSSASAVVKITSSTPVNNQISESRTSVNETANLHWKSKKAAVEMARAMVQANAMKKTTAFTTNSFLISAGENRKGRRPRVVKRTAEEEAQYKAQQLERERENRRQAAYRRLQARRELQAMKKKENKKQKKEDVGEEKEVDGVKKEKGQDDSDSDSEISDVSNCSESDEANEKAILALDVQIEPSVDEVEESPKTDRSDSDDDTGGDDASKDDGDNGTSVYIAEDDQPECHSSRIEVFGTADPSAHVSENSSLVDASSIEPEDNEEVIAGDTDEILQEDDNAKSICEAEANEQQIQEETIVFDLQSFVASRAAAKLEQLGEEKEVRDNVDTTSPLDVSDTICSSAVANEKRPSISSSGTGDDRDADKIPETSPASPITVNEPYRTNMEIVSDNSNVASTTYEKQSSWIDEVRQSAEELKAKSPERIESAGKVLSLPRTPVAECKDYRFYFSNFHCILTSVYEQCRNSATSSSSSSSLYHRPIGATGEHTMRLQQKLYESWQSIMQDYATVFGPKIIAPEGMVPLSAAKPWAPHYRINSTARKEVSDIVTQALQRLGGDWEDHPSGLGLKTTWNVLWTWSKPRVERQTLLAWQKVNHFQHAKALTRKDCLKKHIGKYLAAGERLRQAFDIIPPTFLLPKEYVAFVQAFQERSEKLRRSGFSEGKNIWIMKPVALSRGRGISLVNDLSQVIYGEQVVIQEYIAAPRLLDGFKFDLRLYALVTSFNPLEAFLYDEGFVRLCTRPYEDSDLSNIFIHLTNSSIQKDNEEAIAGSANPIASANNTEKNEEEAAQMDAGGTKTTLAYLWRRLAAEGVDVEQVKRNIDEVVLKALLCGEDQIPFQVNSFDLLGYDILLDADLRPWLIEINSSPSMARDNELDYQVKDAMMLDTLRVVDPLHFDRAKLAQVIARRQRDLEEEKRRPHAHTRHPRETEEIVARQLNEDLTAILRGKVPRAYGEIPENIGNYRRLCPHTSIYNQLVKLKRSCLRREV